MKDVIYVEFHKLKKIF